jgi:DNA-binding PadR family transcriptional regulator
MTPEPRRPESLLPLTPVLFHVLVSLADADRHGYAILKEVAERTRATVVLSTGTLYGLIKRSLADGLIEPSRRRAPAEDDERRRYYRLTAFGRQVVAAEAERLQDMVTSARAKRLIRRSES